MLMTLAYLLRLTCPSHLTCLIIEDSSSSSRLSLSSLSLFLSLSQALSLSLSLANLPHLLPAGCRVGLPRLISAWHSEPCLSFDCSQSCARNLKRTLAFLAILFSSLSHTPLCIPLCRDFEHCTHAQAPCLPHDLKGAFEVLE